MPTNLQRLKALNAKHKTTTPTAVPTVMVSAKEPEPAGRDLTILNLCPTPKPPKVKPRTQKEHIIYSCQHTTTVADLESKPCPQCTAANREWKRQVHEEMMNTEPSPKERLPTGSVFNVTWNGMAWVGSLNASGSVELVDEASSVFALLARLDRRWRAVSGKSGTPVPG